MKTLQELYAEVMNSDDLKKDFVAAAKAGNVDDFLRGLGCDATTDEIVEFLAEKAEDRPLSDDDLAQVAGGATVPAHLWSHLICDCF